MYFKCSSCGNDMSFKVLNNSNPPNEENIICAYCWRDQPITIYVNCKPIQTIKKELSYIDVAGMAYPNVTVSSDIVTVSIVYKDATYNASHKDSGILSPNQTVKIKDGTHFTACFTGSA